jgi:CDP-diacylglycerol--serine O-phosphatidyltransferase
MIKRAIPNLFTLGNLYCGFLSIGFAAMHHYKSAAIFVLIGMMLDSMDGRLARLLGVDSALGRELDSLSDIVSFGVAPAFLTYCTNFAYYGLLGFIISGLFPLFGAFRLARFNVNTKKGDKYFTGVPITAGGGILALLTLLHLPDVAVATVFTAMCFLMVSKIKIPTLKQVPIPKYGTIVTLFMAIVLYLVFEKKHRDFPYVLYVALPLYIVFMIFHFIKKRNKKNSETNKKD